MTVVSIRDNLTQRQQFLPEYVPKLLKFWGCWMQGIRMPALGYPSECTISKIKRMQDGAGQQSSGPRDISTLSDAIGLAVDKAIESLNEHDYRMGSVLVYRYYYELSSRQGCKRIHTSEDVYDDLLKLARWYMVAKLEPWKDFA